MTIRLLGLLRGHRLRLGLAVLLGAAAIGSSLALMAISGWLISKAALRPPILDLAVAIVAVRFFGISRGLLRYLERLVTHDVAFRVLGELRVRLYQALEPRAPAGLAGFRSGDLLARMVSDVEALQDLFLRGVVPPLVAALVLGLAAGVIAPLAAPALLPLLLLFPAAAVGLPLLSTRLARHWAGDRARIRGDLSTQLVEVVQGSGELVAFGASRSRLDSIRRIGDEISRIDLRRALSDAVGEAGLVLATGLAALGVLAISLPLVTAQRLDGAYLATLALTALASFEAVQPLPAAFERIQHSLAAGRRLLEVQSLPVPVTDPPAPLLLRMGVLEVEDAWLRYRPDGPWALAGVSLRLEPGARVALVGPSGSGKTSLANALLRFRELDRGRMLIDGTDLQRGRQDDVRRLIGLCAQDAHVFNASLLDNLRLARPSAGLEEIEEAAGRARLLDWVRSLPLGWETRAGEGGALLSSGQRQRLALARALLAGFPILILDEPTANLDADTARELMEAVLAEPRGRTLLLITHRSEGLEGMDSILVMREGRIVVGARAPRSDEILARPIRRN